MSGFVMEYSFDVELRDMYVEYFDTSVGYFDTNVGYCDTLSFMSGIAIA